MFLFALKKLSPWKASGKINKGILLKYWQDIFKWDIPTAYSYHTINFYKYEKKLANFASYRLKMFDKKLQWSTNTLCVYLKSN